MKLTQDNYGNLAEKVILDLDQLVDRRGRKKPVVTTSKIRNLLAMTATIYNDVVNTQTEKLNSEIIGRINYLKVRFVYEAGREDSVKDLVKYGQILEHLDEIKGSKQQYILFSRYMEALVAYRKFHIGDE